RRMVPRSIILCVSLLAASVSVPPLAAAEHVVELPVLAAIRENDKGVFELLVMRWDKKSTPAPPQLQWTVGGVRFGNAHLGAMAQAFQYAMQRTPMIAHSGTISVQGITYQPTGSDGPSGGAAMAVGFIALFKGDRIQRGVAMTGTLEAEGRIGFVGGIPDKIRAAKREGCHTVLVPRGQIYDARWNLNELAFELNVAVKEVETIDEAYEIMTGNRL
ncbi:MAG TPA: S16 family serine protease, partial [Nitrospira sp.]|nr:S16 family serine protease [Nitrospira sp.]